MKVNRKPTPYGILIAWSGLIPFALISMFDDMVISFIGLAVLALWYWIFKHSQKLKLLDIDCTKCINSTLAKVLLLGSLIAVFSVILYFGSDLRVVFYFQLTALIALTLIDLLAVEVTTAGEPA